MSKVFLTALGASIATALVPVEQFYMAQCPMSSTLLTDFNHRCLENGVGIKQIMNYTLNMVAGPNGGTIDTTTENTSFHGDQEIVAEKYMLCAREQESNLGLGTYQWVNFTACMNGYDGIAICTMYLPHQIDKMAQTCAEAHGFDWRTLSGCVAGTEGALLFRNSEYFVDAQMRLGEATNWTQGIPRYGTAGGDGWGIPIIRIAGVVYKDTPGAYDFLGKRICTAAGADAPPGCGCLKL